MDLDAPLDITIGPYETYNDELFGYKAAFEAYINIRDDARNREAEDSSPTTCRRWRTTCRSMPRYRNPKLGALAPIRVVNEVFAAGDGAHGVRTAAYNLPNDERVVQEKGSKRVMLKNVQEAKFDSQPGADRGARAAQAGAGRPELRFLLHAHPGARTEPRHRPAPDPGERPRDHAAPGIEGTLQRHRRGQGRRDRPVHAAVPVRPRHADGAAAEQQLYTTFLASSFRSLRFGLNEAHGKGMALQFNYLTDKGAFVRNADGTFAVDFAKIKGAVRDLAHDLLTIEAKGDYAGAKEDAGHAGRDPSGDAEGARWVERLAHRHPANWSLILLPRNELKLRK